MKRRRSRSIAPEMRVTVSEVHAHEFWRYRHLGNRPRIGFAQYFLYRRLLIDGGSHVDGATRSGSLSCDHSSAMFMLNTSSIDSKV